MFKKTEVKKEQNEQISNGPKGLREKMLTPYLAGLKGKDKPKALILNLSFDISDQRDVAVDYKAAKQLVEDRGYTVINSDELVYDVEKGILNKEKIIADRFGTFKKPITIWLEAHSSPSWIFGAYPDFFTEQKAVLAFRNCLVDIEKKTGLQIDNILLHSCFSATEIINEKNGHYTNSSARLLSIVMPDKNILGFIGLNSGVKVSHIYMPVATSEFESEFEEVHLPLIKGSMVFKAGKAIEYTDENFFCTRQSAYIKPFVLKSCSIETCAVLLSSVLPTKENYLKLPLGYKIGLMRFDSDEEPSVQSLMKLGLTPPLLIKNNQNRYFCYGLKNTSAYQCVEMKMQDDQFIFPEFNKKKLYISETVNSKLYEFIASKKLHVKLYNSNAIYVRFNDQLFYVDRKNKGFAELGLNKEVLEKFDKIVALENVDIDELEALSEVQLQNVESTIKHVAIKTEQQIYFSVCPARESIAQYRKKHQFTEECFADKQLKFFEEQVESMKLNATSELKTLSN